MDTMQAENHSQDKEPAIQNVDHNDNHSMLAEPNNSLSKVDPLIDQGTGVTSSMTKFTEGDSEDSGEKVKVVLQTVPLNENETTAIKVTQDVPSIVSELSNSTSTTGSPISEGSPGMRDETVELDRPKTRLIFCQICEVCEAKYTCPRCSVKTCSVSCVKEHKSGANCSGERNKLEFVDMSQYNDSHLLSDYRFLEEAERKMFSNASRRQGSRLMPYSISTRCKLLMKAAYKRGVSLKFVSPTFTKSKSNTSFFTVRTDSIDWHIDWLFTSTNTVVKDNRVPETSILVEAARKFTNFTENAHLRKGLEAYRSEALDASSFLLKLEGLPANRPRYFPLRPTQTVGENLKGMCLTEYPTILVIPGTEAKNKDEHVLLSPEDLSCMDPASARHMLQHHPHLNPAIGVEKDLLNPSSGLYD